MPLEGIYGRNEPMTLVTSATSAIKTAVLPVAGIGTRFLPATKAIPKEMLPIVDRPLIQYAIDEAVAAGISNFVFVVGSHNRSLLEAHFGSSPVLEKILKTRGKSQELELVTGTSKGITSINFVTQDEPLGLGHAVWCARDFINDGPFAVMLPDDLVQAEPGCMWQMVDAFNKYGGNIVAVEDVPRDQTNKYGILDVDEDDGRIASARGLVEKPNPEDAPSTLSVIGRYILGPEVLEHLERGEKGAGNEIQLTDAIAATIGRVEFRGLRFSGDRFDCGSKAGFVAANVAYALARSDIPDDFKVLLKSLI